MGSGSNALVPLNGPREKLMLIPGAGGGLEGLAPGCLAALGWSGKASQRRHCLP